MARGASMTLQSTGAALALLALGGQLTVVDAGSGAERAAPFSLMFSESASTSYASEADVSTAVGKWTAFIAGVLEPGRPVTHAMVSDAEQVVTAMKKGEVDFAVLGAIEFLELERRLPADPLLTYETGRETQVSYVLVAPAAVTSLGALAGSSLQMLRDNGHEQPWTVWLEVLLAEARLPALTRHFTEISVTHKPSQALLAVYFGRSRAALVPRSAYETALELNPDFGRKVKILATSPPLLRTLVCASRRIDPATRTRWAALLARAHQGPGAAQLFTLFKVDRFVPWNAVLLDNLRALVAKHAQVSHGSAARAGAETRP